jgi:hypothetical protein
VSFGFNACPLSGHILARAAGASSLSIYNTTTYGAATYWHNVCKEPQRTEDRGGRKMFFESEISEQDRKSQQWEPVVDRELRLRKQETKVVSVEECGKIIGRIISPVEGDIFGRWCGAVYLARD